MPQGRESRTCLKIGSRFKAVIPAIPNAFGRSGILLKTMKDSGQAGMTHLRAYDNILILRMSENIPPALIAFQSLNNPG